MIKNKLELKKSLYNPLSEMGMVTVVVDFDTFLNQIEKTYLDLSFQRDGGWKKEQKSSFLELTKESGHVFSPIYICDNDDCYKNATDDETKEYFFARNKTLFGIKKLHIYISDIRTKFDLCELPEGLEKLTGKALISASVNPSDGSSFISFLSFNLYPVI